MKNWLATFSILIFCPFVHADLSCEKTEDVDQMVKEVYVQLYCSNAKNILECGNFMGIQSTAGASLSAIAVRGLSGTMDKVSGVCKPKKVAWWSSLLPTEAYADSCLPDFQVASQEAGEFLEESRRDLYHGMNQQEQEMREQMRRIREAAEYYENKGAPDGDDWNSMKKIDREYQEAVRRVDQRHMPRMISSLEQLVGASDQSLRVQAEPMLAKLKLVAASEVGSEAYKQMDDLLDLYEIRRPYDRVYLNKSQNPLVAAVESANQERTFDLSDEKRTAYKKLEKLPPPKSGGPLFLEYSSVEKYELEKMSRDMVKARSPVSHIPTVTPKPGSIPDINTTYFRDPGYSALSGRYPMLMEEPRIREQVEHLKNQSWRLSEMVASYNSVQNTLKGAKHVFTSMEGANKFFANIIPRMPEGSVLAASRQAFQEKFESLNGGKGWSLSAEAIKKYGLQEVAAGGARLLTKSGLSIAVKAGVLLAAGPFAVAGAFADVHSVMGLILPEKVNCEAPCSEYLNFDSDCKPNAIMNNKSQAFIKLKTGQQLAEIKKCPAMCDQLKGLYAQANPTLQWQVQCFAGADGKGFSLSAKDRSKPTLVTFRPGEGNAKRVKLDQVSGLGPAQEVFLNNNGAITSIRLPKRGGNPSPEVAKRRLALLDSAYYDEVSASEIERPTASFQNVTSNSDSFLKSIQYAATEADACCATFRGEKSLDQKPGRKRCQEYGIQLPAAADRSDHLKIIPAGESH